MFLMPLIGGRKEEGEFTYELGSIFICHNGPIQWCEMSALTLPQRCGGNIISDASSAFTVELNTDRFGGDYQSLPTANAQACQEACMADRPTCKAFTFTTDFKICYLKNSVSPPTPCSNCISGVCVCVCVWRGWVGLAFWSY